MNKGGLYILVIELKKDKKLIIGKLGEMIFESATYLYVGSAMTNLYTRIKRHFRKNKKLFWHIDYLLSETEIKEVWMKSGRHSECEIVKKIQNYANFFLYPIKRFGSSDCKCLSHLFYTHEKISKLRNLISKLKFERLKINGN